MDDAGLELADGIEAKQVILTQLAQAFEVIRQHDPSRIVTLGSECAVSVAPFSELARRDGDDLAIVSPDRVALVGLHVWAEDDIGQCGPIGDPRLQPG
jgi:arginase